MATPIEVNVLLLVEDDENDIVLTERKITRSEVTVKKLLLAHSLDECKQMLTHEKVDIVLLDLNLGDSRGLDTLRAVRPIYDGVIIVLTSIEDEATGIQAIREGADDYVVKNQLTEESFRKSIAYSVGRHRFKHMMGRVKDNLDKLGELV